MRSAQVISGVRPIESMRVEACLFATGSRQRAMLGATVRQAELPFQFAGGDQPPVFRKLGWRQRRQHAEPSARHPPARSMWRQHQLRHVARPQVRQCSCIFKAPTSVSRERRSAHLQNVRGGIRPRQPQPQKSPEKTVPGLSLDSISSSLLGFGAQGPAPSSLLDLAPRSVAMQGLPGRSLGSNRVVTTVALRSRRGLQTHRSARRAVAPPFGRREAALKPLLQPGDTQ